MSALRRGRSILFDLLVAAGVAGLTGLGIFMRETPDATMSLGYTMAAAVLFRRRFPLSTMAVVSAAALLQVIAFPPRFDPLPYDLAVLVAMYSVVKYGKRMSHAYIAAAVVTTGIVIEVVRHFGPSWWALALWYVGVCGGVWLMGYSMRNRRIYVTTLEERAATLERERDHLARIAVADERAAIARELHDVVAHSLAVMIVQADGGGYALDTDPNQARHALKTVADTGREALADMRRLVDVLRGADATGTPAAAGEDRRRVTLDQLELVVERARSAGIAVAVKLDGNAPPMPPAVELAVFRIVQEALTNVLRHAGAGASVRLTIEFAADEVSVSVVDDGGHDPTPAEATQTATAPALPGGHGLIGMRERVNVHGGRLSVGPRTGRGWAVDAAIPLRAAAAEGTS